MESKLVAGRYRKLRELGRGGMGVVWLAEDQVIGRRVALKELRTSSRTELERVLREARTAGRLNSPAVVTVHDVLSEHGITYIVMELVEAPTLADLMRTGPMPAPRVEAIGLEVLKALETAHAAGVVHRDVKPGNVMVLPDGGVKLADFGIARAMDDPGLTATGGVMGSPGYMAPELFHGRPPSPASDLWALGATMFHAAEGRSPFQRETTAATMHAIMYEEPVLVRTTEPLAGVVMGLLTQSAEARLTAAQVRAHLTDRTRAVPREPDTVVIEAPTSFVTTAPPSDTRPGRGDAWDDETPKPKRRIAVPAGAAVAVTALALMAVFVLFPEAEPGRASGAQDTGPSGAVTTTTGTSAGTSSAASSTSAPSTTTTTTTAAVTTSQGAAPPPAVATTTTTTAATPARETTVFTRFRNAEGWHYSGSALLGVPAGYAAEGPLGKLAVNPEPGTRPLYSCKIAGSADRMSSVSANCENQQVYGVVGHIFTARPADAPAQPIYRCNMGGHHFESLSPSCEGKTVEFQLGWVLGN
ncbi:serine/threonine protein kinase [Saccharothrix tamanrassetensis]|uniref:non-specific serine/threonine protein kinase n=1 Tax=Saccharothrix tamanrassetensis TaxID=1051531 RepID=A0A841CF27_9PSEU|nr:serine/threonine-protein kinase [Saccharothrix tamanrassetensis]MBB5955563.1 serine/threonine protein kinase [Saccharothrix tamanrassetensis]